MLSKSDLYTKKVTIGRLGEFDFVSAESGDLSGKVHSDGVPRLGDEVVQQQSVGNLDRAACLKSDIQNPEFLNNVSHLLIFWA